MKTKDLMLGDWVCYRISEDKVSMPMQVCLISEGEVCLTFEGNEADPFIITEDELLPIPLTEEILIQNGFGYIERDTIIGCSRYYLGEPHFCRNMDLHIGTDNNGHFWLNYLRNAIDGLRYVHELQHAFWLCGIDKEIKL